MGRMKDRETSTDSVDYCHKCWAEFTTLTDQELNIWKSLLCKKHGIIEKPKKEPKPKKVRKPHKKVICINTGKVYFNCAEASKDTGIPRITIWTNCQRGLFKEVKPYSTDLIFKYYKEGTDD